MLCATSRICQQESRALIVQYCQPKQTTFLMMLALISYFVIVTKRWLMQSHITEPRLKGQKKKINSTDETKNSGDWWNQGTMSSVEKLRQRTFWGTTKRRSTPESLVFQRNFCCVWKENLSANHPAKEHSQLVAWCTVGLPWCFSCHILLFILKKRKLESCFDWWHTIFLFAFFPQNFSHQITH